MEKRITFYPPQTWRGRFLGTILTLVAFLLGATQAEAQTVHIGLDNGSLVNAVTPGDETGWANGFSTLWRHEQLSLSMMGSDRDELTEGGGIGYPSAVFGEYNGKITIVGGRRPSFMVVSLPKGYRITGYTIVLSNNIGSGVYTGNFANLNSNQEAYSSNGYGTMRFYETEPWATDQTNAGTHGRDNGQGYNTDQVRYIEPGPNWQNGQIGSEIIRQAEKMGADGKPIQGSVDIKTNEKGQKFIISRYSQTDDDMGNQLYFRLVKDYCFYGITIEEFRLEFTAEGTFPADVTPDAVGAATSLARVPFDTSKMDIGEMSKNTKDGVTYFSFDYENVKDLKGYNYLYQEDAVENGVPADVATNKHITPVQVDGQMLYALENDTYYIETPTEIVTGSGNTAPIGYRIVGALFTPLWGTETEGGTIPGGTYNYITYTNGENTYYLNEQGKFILNPEVKTAWVSDNNGVHSGDAYLVYSRSGQTRTLQIGTIESTQKVQIDETNGRLYYQGGSTYYVHGTTDASAAPTMSNDTNGLAAWTEETTQGVTLPSFSPGAYKLKVWNREGTAVRKTIEISGADDSEAGEVYDMGLCNNDAIKFQITDLPEGKQALVQVTLLLQALDPYIDKMDIVCTDNRQVLHLTQSFTADDFSVSGGKFIFYVPEDYVGQLLTFTFSDLYSKYGDETYYRGGSGSARYSFVTSDYFFPINQDGDDGLYDSAYDPDADYGTKIYTSTAGNIRFKFNNAEDLGIGGGQQEGFLEEYPFSVPIYLDSTDPGDPLSSTPHGPDESTSGTFIPVKLTASTNTDENSGTFFVFTADETRWNIAPTKNLQHRYYAFYRMEIEVRAKTFTPDFTWTQIYDKSCYSKVVDGEETKAEDSMWGVTLDVADTETINGEVVKVTGYLTYQEIINAINADIANNSKVTPDGPDQILYIDGTPLYAMLKSAEGQEIIDIVDLQPLLAKNALIFLPENTTSLEDNVAYETETGFVAGKDIKLTDKQPFYSPYDIQVAAANKATYTRLISATENGKAKFGTIMIPFTLTVNDEGVHTNPDGTKFMVNKMVSGANMELVGGSAVDHGIAFFGAISDVTSTVANTPYMVKVDLNNASSSDDVSFVATQTGAKIEATPTGAQTLTNEEGGLNLGTGWVHTGEADVNATFSNETYTFTNRATFSGAIFDRAKSENVFYFAAGKYLDLHTLAKSAGRYLYIYPFRGVYTYPNNGAWVSQSSAAKAMKWFDISFDEPNYSSVPTGIEDATDADLIVKVGKGIVTMSASRSQDVNINTLSGMSMKRIDLNAGDTKTVNLPSGIYMINNVKVIVK